MNKIFVSSRERCIPHAPKIDRFAKSSQVRSVDATGDCLRLACCFKTDIHCAAQSGGLFCCVKSRGYCSLTMTKRFIKKQQQRKYFRFHKWGMRTVNRAVISSLLARWLGEQTVTGVPCSCGCVVAVVTDAFLKSLTLCVSSALSELDLDDFQRFFWTLFRFHSTPGFTNDTVCGKLLILVWLFSSKRARTVVPKLVWAVTQIKATIMSYYPQYFAVIAHNTEQHCDFGSALLPEESHITPGGVIYPTLWEPLS